MKPTSSSVAVSEAIPHSMQATRLAPQPLPRPKVGMISLGCAKNLVDAEVMLGSVLEHDMEITSSAEDADVVVVNTCGFIEPARQESLAVIREMLATPAAPAR